MCRRNTETSRILAWQRILKHPRSCAIRLCGRGAGMRTQTRWSRRKGGRRKPVAAAEAAEQLVRERVAAGPAQLERLSRRESPILLCDAWPPEGKQFVSDTIQVPPKAKA